MRCLPQVVRVRHHDGGNGAQHVDDPSRFFEPSHKGVAGGEIAVWLRKTAQWCRPRGAGDPNPNWLGRHGVNAKLADSELKDLRLESWKVPFFTETQHRPAFSSPRLNPGSASSKKAGAEPLARHRRGTRVANPRQGDFAKPDCEIGQASARRLARAGNAMP